MNGHAKPHWLQNSLIHLCGGSLALNILLIIGLMCLLSYHGLSFFWPKPIVEVTLKDGSKIMGEIHDEETAEIKDVDSKITIVHRMRMKLGNRDLTGSDFRWVNQADVTDTSTPKDAVILERLEWGNFFGRMTEVKRGAQVLATGSKSFAAFAEILEEKELLRRKIRRFEKSDIGDINYTIEQLRLEKKRVQRALGGDTPDASQSTELTAIEERTAEKQLKYQGLAKELDEMRRGLEAETVVMETADGTRKEIKAGHIVRAVRPNALALLDKVRIYCSRTYEFIFDEPRESNTEGGIFPAIFGTVMMVFLMSLVVAPFGVLAAVYLREYAKQGLLVRIVRIAVNNLAGVPSIVFGVFGLGFFVYLVGGTIDQIFYPESLPTPTYGTGGILWAALTLALLTVPVVIVATEEGLAAVPSEVRAGSLALGATKFETLWKIVVPAAGPGILTGMILAMARAAGEVAPLMIVGMVKLAPTLPIDGQFPFVHLERKFMHLGFHIYDVGFQSPNVEATRPLVFATSLLLVLVVGAVNLGAIVVRNQLRKKYASIAI